MDIKSNTPEPQHSIKVKPSNYMVSFIRTVFFMINFMNEVYHEHVVL